MAISQVRYVSFFEQLQTLHFFSLEFSQNIENCVFTKSDLDMCRHLIVCHNMIILLQTAIISSGLVSFDLMKYCWNLIFKALFFFSIYAKFQDWIITYDTCIIVFKKCRNKSTNKRTKNVTIFSTVLLVCFSKCHLIELQMRWIK